MYSLLLSGVLTVAEAAVLHDLKRVTVFESIRMRRTLHSRSAEILPARYHDFETLSFRQLWHDLDPESGSFLFWEVAFICSFDWLVAPNRACP